MNSRIVIQEKIKLDSQEYNAEGKSINGFVQGENNTVTNIFSLGFEALNESLKRVFYSFIPESVKKETSIVNAEKEYLTKLEELELEREKLNIQIISNEQILEIENSKIEIQKQEHNLKHWFFGSKLNLIRECHAESVQLKLQEFQVNWDINHLPFFFSREETQNIFFQEGYKLWVLLAPPKIECDIPAFKSLDTKIKRKLKSLIKKYYIPGYMRSPVGFKKVFKEPIEDEHALQTRELLAPIPTLIINSEITDQEVFITVTFPVPIDSDYNYLPENQVSLPSWEWELIYERLKFQDQSDKRRINFIQEIIVALHAVIVLYFSDLFCININPYHSPKLIDFLDEPNSNLKEYLCKWAKPYKDSLLEIRKSEIEKLEAQKYNEPEVLQTPQNDSHSASFDNQISYFYQDSISPISIGIGGFIALIFFGLVVSSPNNIDANRCNISNSGRESIGITQVGLDMLNLRNSPNGQEIAKLQDGICIQVLGLSGDGNWYQVKTQDRVLGWVYAKHVKLMS